MIFAGMAASTLGWVVRPTRWTFGWMLTGLFVCIGWMLTAMALVAAGQAFTGLLH